ncbi:hypothetical protein GCM10018781_56080 [Kitasatospora indigofera]|uniref:Aminoglycoside phosphotransferase domain-containing protein n=1 Tax=Kitasatospora indigofera TaxID=67307 RepID=A0A919G766_9ACTN|nr:phosphotransferase [Kitasatospora indigofera]GHH79019.1 hypothetical protein GCM10018781_56080 [Kitasatospora indigofera]
MTDFPPPPELLVWLAGHLPGPVTAADWSWPRATSRVWRIGGPDGGNAFLKISPDDGAFAREVAGYAYAARYLPERQAPRLLASDPGLRALLSAALPGRVVRGLPLERAMELRLHEEAGRLLRRWHDHSDAGTADHRAAVREAMGTYAREAAQCREALAGQVPPDVLALLDAAATEIPAWSSRSSSGCSGAVTRTPGPADSLLHRLRPPPRPGQG